MRSALFSLIVALFATVTMAVAPTLKEVIITFPAEAPDHLVAEAKQKCLDAGGQITHEYTIIKGFAAKCPEKLMGEVQAMSSEYPAVIEGDGIMTTQDDKTAGI